MKRRFWTKNETDLLKKLYPDNYTADVAKRLNRSVKAVYMQAKLMGVKKSAAFMVMELQKQGDRLRVVGVQSRYQKGRTPENKGKKMSQATREKVKHTWFRKGNIPCNTKYDGHERLSKDGYIEIRVRMGKYELKHRLIWEQHNGKIPKGYCVIFRDSNKLNLDINNLGLISRKENMLRNTFQRYPGELQTAIRLTNKLKRKINEKQTKRPQQPSL